jgi:2-polyprenyl-3-methyl-5-hydroxy-6-metoxy-1,4-benzoquinol methylase
MMARAPKGGGGFQKGSMESFPLLRESPYKAVRTFCEFLSAELNFRTAHGLNAYDLRHYHRKLFLPSGTLDPIGVEGYASRIASALNILRVSDNPMRLLDSGCGYGTESLLFAAAGANVTGIDLVSQRVQLASSRIDYYERRTSRHLNIGFLTADVIRYLETALPFDMIWAMEAISHIHPLERFLELAFERLSPNGFLIASDPNGLNPLARYKAYRIRGTHRLKTRVKAWDAESGEPAIEAVERIFSVLRYQNKLEKAGFHIAEVVTSGFLASSFIPNQLHQSHLLHDMLTSLQTTFQKIPVLRLFGTNFTVVAQKRSIKSPL